MFQRQIKIILDALKNAF